MRNRITELESKQIRNLHDAGKIPREIGALVGRHPQVVRYHIVSVLGLITNGSSRRVPIQYVGRTHARCKRCGETKTLNNFRWERVNTKRQYRLAYCNTCRNRQINDNLNSSEDKYIVNNFKHLRQRAKARGIKINITCDEVLDAFKAQDGKCFYTDVAMRCKIGTGKPVAESFSIDKIDPTQGYVHGNFVLCCNRVNSIKRDTTLTEMKEWMPGWYQRLVLAGKVQNRNDTTGI